MSNTFNDRTGDDNFLSERSDDRRADGSDRFSPGAPPQPSGCRTFAMGCGCALGVLLLVALAGGVWVALNWKGWTADLTKKVAEEAVKRSSMPAADKARVLKRINDLADDFKAGRLSTEQAGRVMEQIAKGPLLPIGIVMAVDENYLKPSGLTDEEKAAGRRAVQRFARGAFEKKIPEHELQELVKLISTTSPDGQQQIKEHLTDAELNAFLKKAKDTADVAGVPDEPFEVNIADELEKAIDRALKP